MLSGQHSALDGFQRLMLENGKSVKTKFEFPMSPTKTSSHLRTSSESSPRPKFQRPQTSDSNRRSTKHSGHGLNETPPATAHSHRPADPQAHSYANKRAVSGGSARRVETASSSVSKLDAFEEAGFSELQAAFEKAYDRMLRIPPPSVVDTVLSSAWKPKAVKSAEARAQFERKMLRCSCAPRPTSRADALPLLFARPRRCVFMRPSEGPRTQSPLQLRAAGAWARWVRLS